jgi:hypothetical protein
MFLIPVFNSSSVFTFKKNAADACNLFHKSLILVSPRREK